MSAIADPATTALAADALKASSVTVADTVAEATAEATKVAAEAATAEAVIVVATKVAAEAATVVETVIVAATRVAAAEATKAAIQAATKVIRTAVAHGHSVKRLQIGLAAETTVLMPSTVVQAIRRSVDLTASPV